jgi:cytosine/adenosine deaminase-related metal-dependent hydrolase
MHYLSADCILPVTGDPHYNSVLAIADDGTVEGVFSKGELKEPLYEIRHYNGILCPGFVNTHCHLELSWAKGLISMGEGLDQFIRQLEEFRSSVSETYIKKSLEQAANEMAENGVVATADISNGNHTLEYKTKSGQYFHTFVEVFGSNPVSAEAVFGKAIQLRSQFENTLLKGKVSIVPHATYSLSEELFSLIAGLGGDNLLSIHHQENADENHFFEDGSGWIARRRKAFNPDLPDFAGTAKRPMESIARYFSPDQKILLVHNTVSERQDIGFANSYFTDAYWCLCPNANLYIEKQLPDISLLRRNNCRITLGTDSLASNHQLNILEEIKSIQQHFPEIPLTEILHWGTLNGAYFLGLEKELGSFEKGKNPGIVLIENVDIKTLTLNPKSTSRLLIPSSL